MFRLAVEHRADAAGAPVAELLGAHEHREVGRSDGLVGVDDAAAFRGDDVRQVEAAGETGPVMSAAGSV